MPAAFFLLFTQIRLVGDSIADNKTLDITMTKNNRKRIRTVYSAFIGVLFALCISPMGYAKQPLDYIDVFAIEYPSSPQFSNKGQFLYYLKNVMDSNSDSTVKQVWRYSLTTQKHIPILADVEGLSDFSLSPQGDKILYRASTESGSQLFMHYIDENRSVQLTQLDTTPYGFVWSNDGKRIAYLSRIKQKDLPLFTEMPKAPKGSKWSEPAKVIGHVRYRADGGGYTEPSVATPFILSADGGIPQQVGEGEAPHASSLSFSNDDQYLYASANIGESPDLVPFGDDILRYDIATGEYIQLTNAVGSEVFAQMSPDGKWLAYLYVEDEKLGYQFPELMLMSQTDKSTVSLTKALDRRIGGFEWDNNSKSLVFSYIDAGKTRLARVQLNGDIIGLSAELGGQSIGRPYTSGEFTVSPSGDIAFTSASTQRPAELEILVSGKGTNSFENSTIQPVTNMNVDWMSQRALADVQAFQVKSSLDGLAIDAWVATPPDFDDSKQYPLILEIHGGPHAAYGPQFSMEIQLMAAKGYVVVWANPRGSSSYGSEFGNLIHHNYPSNDYQDLMDVVDAISKRPYIDSENLFITGGSGGGTLTAWSIGKTNRFRAAVVAKPVINWISFGLTADAYPYFTQYWMADMPWNNHEALWQHSPLSLVGNVKTPTMLLTGESDYRTPISETEQYYQALKLQQVDAVMVRIPGASHGIASRPTRLIQKVGHILAWFEKYKTDESEPDEE